MRDAGRLLPADRRSSCVAARPASARPRPPTSSRAIEARASSRSARVLFAIGIEGVGEVTGRNLAAHFRSIDALLAADARADRRDARASARSSRELIHEQLHEPTMRELIDELRGVRAVRAGGPAARRGPAGGQDVRAHRHAARPHARAGDRADPGRGRQGHGLGLQEDRLRRRRRLARAPSSRRPSGSASPCSTRPGLLDAARGRPAAGA